MNRIPNTLDHHWMPFTANRDFRAAPRLLVRAEGIHYWTNDGRQLIDGVSGLFCCSAGHGRREIPDAVAAQLLEMEYAPHFQFAHPSSFALAARLADLTPGDLNNVFFCSSGSEAVDTAIKIAIAYHRARDEGQRTRLISRERAYHGVNVGGTALSGIVRNREVYSGILPAVSHIRHTLLPDVRFVRGQPSMGAELADDLQRLCDLYGPQTIAACFVEPIAGSTGVLVPPQGYLERLRQICDANGILLVFDEVICGFGRTGAAFAAERFGVVPDIMTMAKALTNGALPMGAVAIRDHIYETIVDRAAEGAVELFHGYTASAHPSVTAAALATLDIYAKENLFERAHALSEPFLEAVFQLTDIPIIRDVRGYGLIAAFDVEPLRGHHGARGLDCLKKLYDAGLLIKWTGDTGILAPPFISQPGDFEQMAEILRRVLKSY